MSAAASSSSPRAVPNSLPDLDVRWSYLNCNPSQPGRLSSSRLLPPLHAEAALLREIGLRMTQSQFRWEIKECFTLGKNGNFHILICQRICVLPAISAACGTSDTFMRVDKKLYLFQLCLSQLKCF